jgi:carbon dioxide concentrating mechanism protein CcmN
MLTKLRSLPREMVPVHLYGTVSIDPTAVIAPGVLLQAESNSQISIGPGACIGAGTIIQAAGGLLKIGAGACLGREVLVVGRGSIESNACIGSGSTLLDPQIEEGAVIPTDSLVGDRSRGEVSVVVERELPTNLSGVTPPENDTFDVWDNSATEPPVVAIELKSTSLVAGRAQFELLKRSLFPNSGNNDYTA